jgi:hypothetical protein
VYYNTLNKLVIFKYEPGRDGVCPKEILHGYKGQCVDGYCAYNQFGHTNDMIIFNCWAHARRKSIEAHSFDNATANEVLTIIAKLYGVEKHCRDIEFTADHIKQAATKLQGVVPFYIAFSPPASYTTSTP